MISVYFFFFNKDEWKLYARKCMFAWVVCLVTLMLVNFYLLYLFRLNRSEIKQDYNLSSHEADADCQDSLLNSIRKIWLKSYPRCPKKINWFLINKIDSATSIVLISKCKMNKWINERVMDKLSTWFKKKHNKEYTIVI